MKQLSAWILAGENPASLQHAARTTVAAVTSLLVARVFHLPESYWSAITALIVMQSTPAAVLSISVQRFAGTALGAVAGAIVATNYRGSVIAFGVTVFALGLLCAKFRVERSAYRYA